MKHDVFENYRPRHDRLVCIDSDGCVFDTMEIKHKECFCPAMIKVFGLQPISKYAREAWEFENLYSVDRGRSRFITLVRAINLLKEWDEVKEYHFDFPDIKDLEDWVANAPMQNNSALKESGNPVLLKTLEWSLECNERIADMVKGIPPFPYAAECIRKLSEAADIVIVSSTAKDALEREWQEHDLLKYVHFLCSQEEGTKKECIAGIRKWYEPEQILMIGDAPGDKEAARANGVLFYPIMPGDEINSWKRFESEEMSHFADGTYQGEREQKLEEAFEKCLPKLPPWQSGRYTFF